MNPRDVVPESNMPAYMWLTAKLESGDLAARMKALQRLGVPYTEAEIEGAVASVKDKTEMDAVIAYLQGLGTVLRNVR